MAACKSLNVSLRETRDGVRSLNRLSNTWNDTVGDFAHSDAIVAAINSLNGLLTIVNSFTSTLGSLNTLSIIGGGIAGARNLG